MEYTEHIPRPGEIYRHFKGHLYQIAAVAEHTETGEKLVIYQALYEDFKVYARPLSMFNSPVDKKKYPNAVQQMRFQKEEIGKGTKESELESDLKDQDEERPNPLLIEFLEAEDLKKQLEVLKRMRGHVGQKELDSLYVVLDLPPSAGEPDGQLSWLIKTLETRQKYDGSRLR